MINRIFILPLDFRNLIQDNYMSNNKADFYL
jgi:hypothetical protein